MGTRNEKTEYEFIYQSRLQRFYYVLSIIAGIFIFQLPIAILTNYLLSLNNSADWLLIVLAALGIVLLPLGIVMGAKIGMRWVSNGTLHLYSDHAMLYYDDKTLALGMKDFCIKSGQANRRSFYPQKYYEIRMEGQRVRFYEAIISFRKPCYDPSLSRVMLKLMKSGLPALTREITRALKKIRKNMNLPPIDNADRILKIGDIPIYIKISTPEVFENSPYFVDYSSCCATKGVSLCTCLVRETADPEHVVGDIGFEDDPENEMPKNESVLSKSVIVDGTALDERIGVE